MPDFPILDQVAPTKSCGFCGSAIPLTKYQCPSCRQWNLGTGSEPTNNRLTAPDGHTVDFTSLDKVKGTNATRSITGPWDACFGGGVASCSVTLLAGEPGAGKSTMALQWLDGLLVRDYNRARYFYTEGSNAGISDYADRLQLRNRPRIDMATPFIAFADFARYLSSETESYPLVLDSASAMSKNRNVISQICMMLKGYADRLKAPVLMLSHINKKGDIAGIKELEHLVDTTQMMRIERAKQKVGPAVPTSYRILHVDKSRFGPNVAVRLLNSTTGLQEASSEQSNDSILSSDNTENTS